MSLARYWPGAPHRIFTVRLVGGDQAEVKLPAVDLAEVCANLLRERALVGQIQHEADGDVAFSDVLIPANRIQMVLCCED